MRFIDQVQITVSSGKGGAGCVSFRRESMIPRGGPDGGDGGRGGHIIFRVNPQLNSLLDLHYKTEYLAENGNAGAGANMTGRDGQDLIIPVPAGTVIKTVDSRLIEDMGESGEFVFLKGGRGGKGNTFFKSSVNQAPLHAQPGETGENQEIILELKLLADVGLIGFPNAGKSTLISRLSAARPKIADYPFTTLIPNLGVVRFKEDQSFVVADIPGLIEGAHQGVGLGTQFLRHIERTRVFVHLIDVSGFDERNPLDAYRTINHELKMHDEMNKDREDFHSLSERAQIVVLNKIDTIQQEELQRIEKEFAQLGVKTLAISAVTGKNIEKLLEEIGRHVFVTNQED